MMNKMHLLAWSLLLALALAQECAFKSSQDATGCECPPMLGGSDCTILTCGNPIVPSATRPALNQTSAQGCSGANQCSDGFGGVGCNVCQSDSACQAAVSAYPPAASRVSSSSSLLGSQHSEVVCNTSPYTYTQGFLFCDVDNPSLTSLYPGHTTLSIQKTLQPNMSLSDPFGDAGTAIAELFYAANDSMSPALQFTCQAASCTQSNGSQVVYNCADLTCSCLADATFCGGPGSTLDLTQTINELQGPLDIECAADGSQQCSFKQSTLQAIFGTAGLGLTGCNSGECVTTGIMQLLAPASAASTSDSGLSGGVVAGLAVLGAIILGICLLYALGKRQQLKAKRDGALARHSEAPPQVGLTWSEISYDLPKKPWLAALVKSKRHQGGGRQLLKGVSGQAPCGEMLAIMGPSGAGKSTLVDILAGKAKIGLVSGVVSTTSLQDTEHASPPVIAYVDQEDVLCPTHTVFEALMFAAQLKLPDSISLDAKRRRANAVLSLLGLTSVANSRIGSAERRGISGGERRRVSIGLELLAQPSILVLDEPTSGLDSSAALRIVLALSDLAKGKTIEAEEEAPLMLSRTTVIATLHQPSARILQTFDSVCVMADGGVMFHGKPSNAENWCKSQGQPLPAGHSVSDHLLEMASSGFIPDSAESEKHASFSGSADPTASRLARRYKPRPVACLLTQLEVLSARELKTLIRDPLLLLAHFIMAIVLGLFVGGLYYQVSDSISGFQNRIGSLFFLSSLISFCALSALSNLAAIRPLFMRERAASFYNPWMWTITRVLFDLVPLRIIPTIVTGTIVYWMVGLHATAANFFKFLLIIVEYSIAVTLFDLLLASLLPALGVAILLAAIICLFSMAFAGFFVNINSITPVLAWLQWLDPLKYCLEAVTVNEVTEQLQINDTIAGAKVLVSATLIMKLLFGFEGSAYYRDVLILGGWIIGFGLCLMVSVVLWLKELR